MKKYIITEMRVMTGVIGEKLLLKQKVCFLTTDIEAFRNAKQKEYAHIFDLQLLMDKNTKQKTIEVNLTFTELEKENINLKTQNNG